MRALPGHVNTERQDLLRRYLHAWLSSHALTLGDLTRADVRKALLDTLAKDFGAILDQSAAIIAGQIGMGVMKLGVEMLQRGAAKLIGRAQEDRR